jgi:hypothetical protein
MNQRFPEHANHIFPNQSSIPSRGLFTLRVNNKKKRGRMQPIRTVACEGTLYSSKHVNLDTQELPVYDFSSFSQMISYLQAWGDYSLEWVEGGNDEPF